MSIFAYIINDPEVRHWGLTSRQRLSRVLKSAGVTDILEDIAEAPSDGSVIMVNGGYLFDDRVIKYLLQRQAVLLKISDDHTGVTVAAHVGVSQASEMLGILNGTAEECADAGIKTETLDGLSLSFREQLLKFEPPFVLPITSGNQRLLERRLFKSSYKGVTDIVTKWIWPRPAQWVVGRCVDCGLSPNHVTIIGLVMVVLAGILFADGRYGWGLAAAWLMTFLDTVDGKLARVTVTSSRFGHYFDHLIDLIHPPVWYILWGMGLQMPQSSMMGIPLTAVYLLIVTGYVAGRLAEGVFLTRLGKFGIFCWRPIDSYFRLITARRNPCLIFLTIGYLAGRPDSGLLGVTIWTVATSIFLLIRLLMALNAQRTEGHLRSWLSDINPAGASQPLAVRLFTHRAGA